VSIEITAHFIAKTAHFTTMTAQIIPKSARFIEKTPWLMIFTVGKSQITVLKYTAHPNLIPDPAGFIKKSGRFMEFPGQFILVPPTFIKFPGQFIPVPATFIKFSQKKDEIRRHGSLLKWILWF